MSELTSRSQDSPNTIGVTSGSCMIRRWTRNQRPLRVMELLTVKELQFYWSIKGVMDEVELVTGKRSSGPAVDKSSEDLRGFTELGIEDKQPGRLQAELRKSVGVVGNTDWSGDIKGDGLWALQGLAVKV
ncbi:hypothetical protein C0993_009666 [Termitomyces sp. T159_Od127]|nr:hypothetical protein C0993_009666 [Termitomyces sp. T159_Od127]